MTELLFDTKFTAEEGKLPGAAAAAAADATAAADAAAPLSPEGTLGAPAEPQGPATTTLPLVDEVSSALALINYRVLVLAKEAGCLIGQNGSVINSIREVTNTKAGILKLQNGLHERILTVSGTLDEALKALLYFAQALCDLADTQSYVYFPLKQLSSIACVEGETTVLRLLVPNLQMGTLIGLKGLRIQQIQSTFDISMIALKLFLPNSNERLVELQGLVDNLYEALRVILRCLIEDFSSIVGTNYYVPKSFKRERGSGDRAERGGERSGDAAAAAAGPAAATVTTHLPFPNNIVGALIGKNGLRIQGVRKVSGATIGISDEADGLSERIFTVSGTPQLVEKAKDLLFHNLEREEQRRLGAEGQ